MNDKFTESELIGRKLFKSFLDLVLATELLPTEDKFNPVDYYFTLLDKKVVAEIKVRAMKYEGYSTHLMEVSKFEALRADKNSKNLYSAWYVNFFSDEDKVIGYIYKLSDIAKNAHWETKYCPATTAVASEYKDKLTLMIPKSAAYLKIELVNGKWLKL